MRPKYTHLLEQPDVRRWFQNVSRGSRITGDIYLRRLGGFCESNATSPVQLIRMKPKKLHNLLLDTVGSMEDKGSSGGYIASVLKAVRSWLVFNEVEIKNRIKIRHAHDTPTLQDERVPTQDELRSIFLSADEQTRTVCVLLAHSGLRPQVLGNYDGTDGLRLKDFPELSVKQGEILFEKVPTMVRVRANLSKKAHEYFTFLGVEGCDYLKVYLETRIRSGEQVGPESAIIRPKILNKQFIRTINISDAARRPMRKAGVPWRPYVLRSYFDTQLMLAESKGLVIRDYRSFFMGHKGDIEAVYTLNKRKLPTEVIEGMRSCYSKAYQYLQTVEPSRSGEDPTAAFKRQLLLVAGFKPDEIKQEHLDLGEEEFHRVVRESLLNRMRKDQPAQQVVSVNDLESRLLEGWRFVGLLPNDRAIVKQPEAS